MRRGRLKSTGTAVSRARSAASPARKSQRESGENAAALTVSYLREADDPDTPVDLTLGDSTWIIDRGRLLDATKAGRAGRALPVPPPEATDAPVLSREQIDEALCLARFCDTRADRLIVRCSGAWTFPVAGRIPDLADLATRAA